MMIFSESQEGFKFGRWVGNLNTELGPSRLREHLHERHDVYVISDRNWFPKPRFWRATGDQWLQFERRDLQTRDYLDDGEGSGFFWSGKPAVLPSQPALHAGYYVERGYPRGVATQDQIRRGQEIDSKWHWWRFLPMLSGEAPAEHLLRALASLPAERRCIWVSDSTARKSQPFMMREPSQSAFQGVMRHIEHEIDDAHWIDLVAGARFTFEECVGPDGQEKIVPVIFRALQAGHRLHELVAAHR